MMMRLIAPVSIVLALSACNPPHAAMTCEGPGGKTYEAKLMVCNWSVTDAAGRELPPSEKEGLRCKQPGHAQWDHTLKVLRDDKGGAIGSEMVGEGDTKLGAAC